MDSSVPIPNPKLARLTTGIFAAQILLLWVAGWQNRQQLNTDAVAYLRLAEYYAGNQMDLAVSGYWGPLISWLIVPLLKLGFDPLIAARLVMGLSAVIFFFGCRAVFRSFQISARAELLGLGLAALASVFWSVRNITPDLLLAGLLALAVAEMMDARWLGRRKHAVLAGVWWGLAYLAKAIALPLAILVTVTLAGIYFCTGTPWKKVWRSFDLTLAALVILAAPWIIALSLKYHTVTFSTTGRIAHAVAGPPDQPRYHPFSTTFHQPEPGRVTQWEDPSLMAYHYWTPWENADYAAYQVWLMGNNARTVFTMFAGVNLAELPRLKNNRTPQTVVKLLPGFELLWFGLAGLAACLFVPAPRRETLAREKWRRAIVPVACLAALYLPMYMQPDDQRYFYPALPFVWVAVAGFLDRLAPRVAGRGAGWPLLSLPVAALSFGLPALLWLLAALTGLPNQASVAARELAAKLKAAQMSGPIAGSGLMPGGRAGLYTAYFLKIPWLGDELHPTAAGFKLSQARLIVVQRRSWLVDELERDAAFENLDAKLFGSGEAAAEFPLKVYVLQPRRKFY